MTVACLTRPRRTNELLTRLHMTDRRLMAHELLMRLRLTEELLMRLLVTKLLLTTLLMINELLTRLVSTMLEVADVSEVKLHIALLLMTAVLWCRRAAGWHAVVWHGGSSDVLTLGC